MKFNKLTKSVLALGLAAVSTFSVVGCGETPPPPSAAKLSDVEIWSTYATETVWRDVGEYEAVKFPANVTLEAIGGETESAQVIMSTGNKAVASYDVSITDLYCGQTKFDKTNITIYSELYINVAGTEYYTYNGYCADALAPFNSVKALGENTIEKNNNQGIFISFKVPETQEPGTYSGTLKITIGGEDKNIPVSLTVANASIGIENHTKSCFSLMWGHVRGELDSTERMMDKYIEALAEYRLGPNIMMYRTNDTPAEIDYYAKKACEFAKNPKVPSHGLPYDTIDVTSFDVTYSDGVTVTYEKGGEKFSIYNGELMLKYFMAFFYEGLEQGVDPFKKTFIKGFDEPFMWNQDSTTVAMGAYVIKQTKEKAIAAVLADESITNKELLNQMIESLRAVPHVVTDRVVPEFYSDNMQSPIGFDPEVMDLNMCPYFSSLTNQSQLDQFRLFEGNELWWYGCNVPRKPYPTYHLGDTLLSPRLISWMQADYNIIGNLYWATEYGKGANDDGSNWIEDYYEGDGMRSASTYGEGFLLYPGKKYGVDGPIPSLRLEAVRDGLEEFEMIYKLQEIYASKGYSEDTIMNVLYDTLYNGSIIPRSINNAIFSDARERLIDLLVLAESDAGVMITSVKEDRDNASYGVYVNDGYTLDLGDKFTATSVDVEGGKHYTVSTKIGSTDTFEVKTTVNGTEYAVSFDMFGSAEFYSAESFNDQIVQDYLHPLGATLDKELVEGVNPDETASIKYVKLSLGNGAPDDSIDPTTGNLIPGREQRVVIEGDLVSNTITNRTNKIIFEVWSDLDEEIPLTIFYKGTKSSHSATPISPATLKKGKNEIIFTVNSGIWSNIGKFKYFMMSFGEKGDAARTGIYLVGMTVYEG